MPSVEIRGNSDLRKALRRFTPDLEKTLKAELRRALGPVVRKARGFAPDTSEVMRGWQPRSFSEAKFPFYEKTTVIKGIGFTTGVSKVNKNGFNSMATIFNKSAAGSIYETAGRIGPQAWVGPKAGGTSKGVSRANWEGSGAQFIENLGPLTSSVKGRGRLIFRAWDEDQGRASHAVNLAIDTAVKIFNATNTQSGYTLGA
jgi:hypothetical protein